MRKPASSLDVGIFEDEPSPGQSLGVEKWDLLVVA
jgi:hypothetical protein